MKRWDFFSGLTIILCLLMILGGFCIWSTQKQTADMKELIARNYDTMGALRKIRTASTRINAVALTEDGRAVLRNQTHTYEHERGMIQDQLRVVIRAISEPGEAELVERLKALVGDYLEGLDELYSDAPMNQERFASQQLHLGRKAGEIAEVVNQIVSMNEEALFGRRDRAVERGQRATYIALGLVLISLAIYIYTSYRLTQGVFQPLIRLRDSIVNLRESKFAQFVPLEGGDEIGQIAASFNMMATDLRVFIDEKDDRVVAANRLCRAILQALPKPVYIVDNDLQVTLMNPRAEILSLGIGVPGALPAQVRQRVDEASAAGHDLVGDDIRNAIEMEYPDGNDGMRKVAFIPQIFRMKSELGVPEGWAVLLMDVTNLRRLDAAKTKAISTLGHEVKTPVTGIRMTLHLLLEEKVGKLTPDQRELIESGRDDCERLLAVLHSLLELARLESGRAALNMQSVEPVSLLQHAEAMHGTLMKQTGHDLVVETPDAEISKVDADVMHSGRVLGNFLSNAMKYGLPGEPVTLRAAGRADGYVRFSVINRSAVPLSEADQARVFEPFYRRPGEQAEGSGLGLTIAREIATLQAGRIGVWSQNGTVEFYLDLKVTKK